MNKFNFGLLLIMALVLIASCAPKPDPVAPTTPAAPTAPEAPVQAPTETTGEASIDEVGEDISDAGNIDDELDTSELDEVDAILTDIENI